MNAADFQAYMHSVSARHRSAQTEWNDKIEAKNAEALYQQLRAHKRMRKNVREEVSIARFCGSYRAVHGDTL